VRRPPVMSFVAHIAGTQPVAMRQIVAAVILSVSDWANDHHVQLVDET
jgi:hypothetical protein